MGLMRMPSSSSTCILCGVILTVAVLYQPVGACMRSSTQQSSDADESIPVTTELPNYIEVSNCSRNQTITKGCRRNGFCSAHTNVIDNSVTLHCICSGRFTGNLCERLSRRGPATQTTERIVPASTIAVAVTAVVVGLVVVLVVAIVCKLRNRQDVANRRLQVQIQNQRNGVGSSVCTGGQGEGHVNTKMPEQTELLHMDKVENNNTGLPDV